MNAISANNDQTTSERETLADRTKRAIYATRLAELELFEQVLKQASDDAMTSETMDGLLDHERVRLAAIQRKIIQGEPPDPFDRIILDKASRLAEQIGKKLSKKTLRTTRAKNVQLLSILAHSPMYPQSERLRALKQLEDMRNNDPAMTAGEVKAILELPLADAYGEIAKLTLLGRLSREQADQALKALDYRNHAHNVDLRSKYGKREALPATTDAPTPEDEADGYED